MDNPIEILSPRLAAAGLLAWLAIGSATVGVRSSRGDPVRSERGHYLCRYKHDYAFRSLPVDKSGGLWISLRTQCRNFRGTVWMGEQASERMLRTGG